ncbi:hypothetical protein M407DRAFT_242066, partial [Tulasnella calospora MUT 4182]
MSSNKPSYTMLLHKWAQNAGRLQDITWEESSRGQNPHVVWTVILKLADQPIGSGSGNRKKVAKDRAAHQALAIMGIIQTGGPD